MSTKKVSSVKKKAVRKQRTPLKRLKIMVSSTVYGADSDLDQIKSILEGFGYEVIMSKNGTLYVPVLVSNEAACLQAVKDCDLFLGIIFPRYGSGITHKEVKKALQLNKPRWFIAHHYVIFAREILKQYMFRGTRINRQFKFSKTNILDDVRVINMYNDAIQNSVPASKRTGNWAQPFFKTSEIFAFLETQFKDISKRRKELNQLKPKKKK